MMRQTWVEVTSLEECLIWARQGHSSEIRAWTMSLAISRASTGPSRRSSPRWQASRPSTCIVTRLTWCARGGSCGIRARVCASKRTSVAQPSPKAWRAERRKHLSWNKTGCPSTLLPSQLSRISKINWNLRVHGRREWRRRTFQIWLPFRIPSLMSPWGPWKMAKVNKPRRSNRSKLFRFLSYVCEDDVLITELECLLIGSYSRRSRWYRILSNSANLSWPAWSRWSPQVSRCTLKSTRRRFKSSRCLLRLVYYSSWNWKTRSHHARYRSQ